MNETHISWPKRWLMLGVAALAVAGLYSLVLVIARTPKLASLPHFSDLFSIALVVHVDLSVLVWFLCVAAFWWSRDIIKGAPAIPFAEPAAWWCSAAGAALMALSPLHPAWEVIKSNYIPVVHNPIFFLGLGLFASGMALQVLTALVAWASAPDGSDGVVTHRRSVGSVALIGLCAAMGFLLNKTLLREPLEGLAYYEHLFWAGGHILQFLFTQVLMICWFALVQHLTGKALPAAARISLLSLNLLGAASALAAYRLYEVGSAEHTMFFTDHMKIIGGATPAVALLLSIVAILKAKLSRENRAIASAILSSIALFGYGAVLGLMIVGQNVTIPAHYHGVIVGMTLSFMGLTYMVLPELGFRNVASWRMAFWQPIVYGLGQVMHISGLAWSGGYGVLRKTPGELEGGFAHAKAAMGLMGGGGLLAIIGGLLFVVVVIRASRMTKQ